MATRVSRHSSLLSKEFECPICCEEFTDPKVLGECQHSLCKTCLQSYLTQFQSKKLKHFPCPMCRAKCPLPKRGVDGLKDNFTLRNIMRACSTRVSSVSVVECGACCRADATHFCPACDGIYMCRSCLEAHRSVASTSEHNVIGLCSTHFKALDMFCVTCQCAVCKLCMIAEHSDTVHDIRDYREVIAGLRNEVSRVSLGFEQKASCLDQEQSELNSIHNEATGKVESEITTVSEKADNAIGCAEKEMADIQLHVGDIATRIKELEREKAIVEGRFVTVHELKDELHEKKVELIWDLRKQGDMCSTNMTGTLEEMHDVQQRMSIVAKTWNEVKSEKAVDASTYECLMGLRRDMLNITNVTGSLDRVAPFRNLTRRFAKFVPDHSDLGLGYLSREFTSASKQMDLCFSKNKGMHTLKKVVHLPNGRVTALGYGPNAVNGPDSLFFWRIPTTTPSTVIRESDPVVDMVATSSGNLILLRKQRPILRILFTNGGGRKDITVNLEEHVQGTVCCIDTDDRGNYFILYGNHPMRHVLVCNEEGETLRDHEVVGAERMSFCRSTDSLFVATTHVMHRFRWQSALPDLTLASTTPNESGFAFKDISASNNGGEVLTVAHKNGDPANILRVYQIFDQTSDSKEAMKEIYFPYNDMVSANFVSFCVRDDVLILAYADRIEVFNLIC